MSDNKINLANSFNIIGQVISIEPCGNGRINKTFKIETIDNNNNKHEYILQRINTNLFTNPKLLMNNIELVTDFVKECATKDGSDMDVLNIVKTNNGENYLEDTAGNAYRVYDYIKNSKSVDSCADNPALFCECGRIFGEFQNMLRDFDASLLTETIPDFHNTQKRYNTFIEAIKNCKNIERFYKAKETIKTYMQLAEKHHLPTIITSKLRNGTLPLRVTHNDTKLNNVAFDRNSNRALAVLDLDTVMPGAVCYDFGDAIRFGCNTEDEESTDFDNIQFNENLFREYTKGYLSSAYNFLTDEEIESLHKGAMVMTFECGMRFLTDYLQDDVYFGAKYEDNNLNRAKNQVTYLQRLIEKEPTMLDIIHSELNDILENSNNK